MIQSSNKHRLLLIQQALYQKSSENCPLSSNDLVQICYDAGIKAERKAIYTDIQALQDFGMDILFTRAPKQGWFVASRLFETAELKLLIDAVQASSFVTASKTKLLTEKLSQLSSPDQTKQLTREIIYPKNKMANEQIFYTIDQIQQAISENKAIHFYYFDINVHRQKKYRKQKQKYTLVPYAMIWDNQRYYCIGYDRKHQSFIHYRIDKMENISLEETHSDKLSFDLQEYISRVFSMFHGKNETVSLEVDNTLANVFFDQFGQDILISEVKETTFIVHLPVSVSMALIGWLLQFEDKVKVLAPQSMIETIKKTAQAVLSLYENII